MSYSSSGQKSISYDGQVIVKADYNGIYWYVSILNEKVINDIGFKNICLMNSVDVDAIFALVKHFHQPPPVAEDGNKSGQGVAYEV